MIEVTGLRGDWGGVLRLIQADGSRFNEVNVRTAFVALKNSLTDKSGLITEAEVSQPASQAEQLTEMEGAASN